MQKNPKKGGRPALPSRYQLTVHVTKAQLRRIKALQKARALHSMSAAVRYVLEGAL